MSPLPFARLSALAATATAALVLTLAPAAGAGGDTHQPIPGGPIVVEQGFEDVVVNVSGCQFVRNAGSVATLDVSFQLHYPSDDGVLQVRPVFSDGTKGAWGPDGALASAFWHDTGSPVLWHWTSPLMQGRWELRIGVDDPMTGGTFWYLHPTLLDACPSGRV